MLGKKGNLLALFLVLTLTATAGEVKETERIFNKEVTASNEQILEVKELEVQELLLENQELDSSSIAITGQALKEQAQVVKVRLNDEIIVEELSTGIRKKGFWTSLKDFFTGE